MDNIELFDYSLRNQEPYIEDYYRKESIIIPKESKQDNILIINNREVIKNITAFEKARKSGNKEMSNWIIDELIELLDTKGINNSEFTNYWGIYDMSYSSYTTLKIDDKKRFLIQVLDKYIENRHNIYLEHGYSNTTLQVRNDSVAHKRSGGLGKLKISSILENEYGFTKHFNNMDEFLLSSKSYLQPDGDGKQLFISLLEKNNIEFKWSKKHQNKFPDVCIKIGEHIFIVEHKHMKEGGGGQNKQIVEIIDLIGGEELQNNIHYVSFLDGVYFNKLSNKKLDAKTLEQKEQISNKLSKQKNNYFVNTSGFRRLLNIYLSLY